jgi:restriction endonuclease Mrr
MDSYEFKDLIVYLFTRLGYSNIKVGSETAIRGVDLTMEKATDIGGAIRYMVQCEHQPKGVVNLPVIKILHSTVVSTPTLDKGLIVTSGRFSSEAIQYAEEMGIELIDAWKLIELGKKARLNVQKEPTKTVDGCFPVSTPSQITVKLFSFLKSDLRGFEEKTAQIEGMSLKLKPAYMVDYSINATFKTSIGVIHSVNESSTFLLTDTGEPVHPTITNALLPQKYNLSTICGDPMGDVKILEKGEFTKPFKETKNLAEDALIRLYTKTVVYYGANNVRYDKTCVPKQKDINVSSIKQVYIPLWNIMFSILRNKYVIVGVEDSTGITVLPSHMVHIDADSGIRVYPNLCMVCSGNLEPKFVCSDCGGITCDNDSFNCKMCGRQICREHTFFKRRFLIFKDKYCLQCAPIQK